MELMNAVTISEAGSADNLQITQRPRPKPSVGEILIKTKATALNRADILQRKGGYQLPPGASDILGLEVSGEVFEVNSPNPKWKHGDRVMALLSGGGYAEYVTVNENHVFKIPDSLNFEQAAGIPEVWITAYQLLFWIGQIKKGDYVLIHAGASGVGIAAIQLCLANEAIPIVTVGSLSKKQYLNQHFGIEFIINYQEEDFVEKARTFTKGHGVDVILDPIAASNFKKNLEIIAIDGRWVLFGAMGGNSLDSLDLSLFFRKRLRIETSTLRNRSNEYKTKLVSEFCENCLKKFETQEFRVIIEKIFNYKQVIDAHKLLESNSTIGKVILTFQ